MTVFVRKPDPVIKDMHQQILMMRTEQRWRIKQ